MTHHHHALRAMSTLLNTWSAISVILCGTWIYDGEGLRRNLMSLGLWIIGWVWLWLVAWASICQAWAALEEKGGPK